MNKFKKLRQKKWFRILGNTYVLILVIFGIWMLFFDANSWLIHDELDKEIDKLEGNKTYFKKEILTDRTQISKLEDSEELERFAREEYLMKKEGEEIFIIEYEDSLKIKNDE
ncbi:MAG: septum formation initiator family protein [Leeuwenhoekiella sp.]